MSDRSTTQRDFRCTLILPTYNAGNFIAQTVDRLRAFQARHPDWCILYVSDGCPNKSAEMLCGLLADAGPEMRLEAYEKNRGKGYALRRGLALATTPYLVYTDVDLAYDPEEAIKILQGMENGADLVVANRASPESQFVISPRDFPNIYKRHMMSQGFNWWLRKMLPITIRDTQAGLKGITARAWDLIGPHMTTNGFFFDVELLARAGAMGMRIDEIPILVRYVDPTTVHMVTHGWSMIKDTVRLRLTLRKLRRSVNRPAHASKPGEMPL